MTVAYCEREDVRTAMQEASLDAPSDGPLGPDIVTDAIRGVSTWLHRHAAAHWYDSSGAPDDLVQTSAVTATASYDVPSSPHRQNRQLFRDSDSGHVRYPQQTVGPYVKVPLDYHHVDGVDALEVRQRDGSVDDWVADAEYSEGRGEDYYVKAEAGRQYGRSYLLVDANSIGARVTFNDLLRVTVSYGLDAANDDWQDVRRGIALLAAAQLVTDDDLVSAIPDDGQLVNLETQRDQHLNDALRAAHGLLRPYL